MNITAEQLRAICPAVGERAPAYAAALSEVLPRFAIVTKKQVAAFLAQTMHESAGFSRLEENLNYSAEALFRTWPARFSLRGVGGRVLKDAQGKMMPDTTLMRRYARRPEQIANYVYADRMGNGPEISGDGWRYRGRGPIQLTGKDNYRACGAAIGIDLLAKPELLLQPREGCMAAAWFWKTNKLNVLADAGAFTAITQTINGGQIGAADREAKYKLALAFADRQAGAQA